MSPYAVYCAGKAANRTTMTRAAKFNALMLAIQVTILAATAALVTGLQGYSKIFVLLPGAAAAILWLFNLILLLRLALDWHNHPDYPALLLGMAVLVLPALYWTLNVLRF